MSFIQILPEGGLTGSNTVANATLGALHQSDDGNIYRYIQNDTTDAVAIAVGTVVYPTSTAFVYSPDIAGGNGVTGKVSGVGVGAIAAGSYGWVLVSGIGTVQTDTGVAAGDPLIGHTVNGESDTMAAGEEHLVFGHALEADAANLVTALVQCL